MKTKKSKTEKFENRVRFNWGYHDAALAVEQGWANEERNFGFGPAFGKLTCIADILERHHDPIYAQGWQHGYMDKQDGMYEARGRSSEEAWNTALKMGLVTE